MAVCAQKKKKKRNRNGAEDRISKLPDELLHLIFSFMTTKLSVQTCVLSTRWKSVWTSLPHLTFHAMDFRQKYKFCKFVDSVFSFRNDAASISTINLCSSRWVIGAPIFERILRYGFYHGIQYLDIRGGHRARQILIPISSFSSQSLKHLTVQFDCQTGLSITPSPPQSIGTVIPAWNLPNLTTLCLDRVLLKLITNCTTHISADLFSKLVNLKDLRLIYCVIRGLDALHIISLSLQHLTIAPGGNYWPAPTCMYVVSTPNLTSFKYIGDYPLKLSATEQLNCLTEATIHLWNYRYKMPVMQLLQMFSLSRNGMLERLLELFSLARNAMLLTISAGAVEILSCAQELLGNRASPLGNLKCLTMGVLSKSPAIPEDVITYFLNSSPNTSIETMSGRGRRTKLHLND